MAKKISKRQKAKQEDAWLAKLPMIPRFFVGVLKYHTKELLALIAILFLGMWLLTAFNYEGKKVKIKPTIDVDIKVQKGAGQ